MKTQQHLTPSQVAELRELGVEFEDTTCYWALSDFADCAHLRPYEVVLQEYLSSNESLLLYTDKGNGDYDIPAPSLQEVMEKLPNELNHPGTRYRLELSQNRINADEWRICYVCYESSYFEGENPLLLAFELLKWVAKKHPKTLTNKTE